MFYGVYLCNDVAIVDFWDENAEAIRRDRVYNASTIRKLRTDMCTDMCIDMRVDIYMSIYMSIYMYMDMCMDMCIDMRAGIDPWQAVAVASFVNPRGR